MEGGRRGREWGEEGGSEVRKRGGWKRTGWDKE